MWIVLVSGFIGMFMNMLNVVGIVLGIMLCGVSVVVRLLK